ncbi:unnamed protein product [Closterium sp. Yama58-4]|nr:unnamed protein product [Closterium sp. Yama58-4]
MAGVGSWTSRSTTPTPYLPALNTEINFPGLLGGFLSSLNSPGDSIPGLHIAPLLEEQPELKSATSHFACDSTFGSAILHQDETAFMAGAGNEISQTDLDSLAEWIPRLAGGAAAVVAGQPSSIDEIAAELQSLDAKQFLLQQQMTAHSAAGGGGGSAGGEEADLYAALVQQQLAAEMPHVATNVASSAVAFHGRDLEEFTALSRMAGLPNSALGGGEGGANSVETNAAHFAATEPAAALSAALGMIANDPAAARSDALAIRPAAPPQSTAQFSRAASQLAAGNVFGAPAQWPSGGATPQASAGVQIGANWLQNQPQSQSQPQTQPQPRANMEPAVPGPAAVPPVSSADELEALFQQIPPELAPEEHIVLAAALMAEMQRSNAAAAGSMTGYSSQHLQHAQQSQQSQQPQHSQHSHQMHASGGASGNIRGIIFPQAPVLGHFGGDSVAIIGNQPPAFAAEPHQSLAGTRQQHASGAGNNALTAHSGPAASLHRLSGFPSEFQDVAQCMSGPVSSDALGVSESSAERAASARAGGGGGAGGSRREGGGAGSGGGVGGASGGNPALKAIRPRSVKERRRRERISDCLRRLKTAIPQEILGDRQDLGSMIEKSVSYIHSLQARLDRLQSSSKDEESKEEGQ